jgi:putative glutamine amidotransferase
MTRPLILVVGRWTDSIGSNAGRGVYVGPKLLAAVTRAGGEPIMVWPQTPERAEQLVALADAIVLPGGVDLDLRPFGVAEVHPREIHAPPEQDAADVTVARAALASGKPILAICRGMQVLNIVMGGTIHQHFEETTVTHRDYRHVFDVVPGTTLERLVGGTRISGYSNHHQACDRLAEGLTLSASAEDKIIEGFESVDGQILGVQWHPEIDAADAPVQQSTFDWLISRTTDGGRADQTVAGSEAGTITRPSDLSSTSKVTESPSATRPASTSRAS